MGQINRKHAALAGNVARSELTLIKGDRSAANSESETHSAAIQSFLRKGLKESVDFGCR
jgi:hypothetical protein